MRDFIKKFIKPGLKKIGVYGCIYNFYFSILKIKTYYKNLFLKTFTKTSPILLYHRIAEVEEDPLMLCVSRKNFEEHLKFIKENYSVIPLSELSGRIKNKNLKGNEITITFDDGYQDNLLNALPLLEKYNVPATIFITTNSIGQKASFKWDMEYKEKDRPFFLSEEEIKQISKHPLIEIGAHTHTHPRLSDLSFEQQKEEIMKSKNILEKITNKKINQFAYPFGGRLDFNANSEKVIHESGFDFAYSNTGMLTNNFSKSFSIPRINIRDYNKNKLSKIINKN